MTGAWMNQNSYFGESVRPVKLNELGKVYAVISTPTPAPASHNVAAHHRRETDLSMLTVTLKMIRH